MLIANVEFQVTESDVTVAMNVINDVVRSIRNLPGNCVFQALTQPGTKTIVLLQEWQTEAHFNAYLDTQYFKELGEKLKPLMTAPPQSRRYLAEPMTV